MTEIARVRFTLVPGSRKMVRFFPAQFDGHVVACFVEPSFVRVVSMVSGNRPVLLTGDVFPSLAMAADQFARCPLKLAAGPGTYVTLELELPAVSEIPGDGSYSSVEGMATLVLHPREDLRPLEYTLALKASSR